MCQLFNTFSLKNIYRLKKSAYFNLLNREFQHKVMNVYHKYILHTPFEQIDLSIFDKWNPSPIWRDLMKVSIEDLQKAYL